MAYSHEKISAILVELCSEVMVLGEHEQIVCALLQFGGWYERVLGQKEEVPNDELVEDEEGVVQKPPF